ncbi:MAG: NAD(P)-binding protein [Thermoplasmataceae archaeon]
MELLEPGYIGNQRIKNRIAMAPMISNLAQVNGFTSEEHIAYLEERAIGGTGLIITEYTYVNDRNSRGSRNELGAYSMNMSPKLKRLTDRVHMHGSKIFMQLVHAGGKANYQINGNESFAPTAMEYLGRPVKEMTLSDIDSVKDDFVTAAKLAENSGFDGVEIHGAHGYLIEEFISPALNKRGDKFGGTFENRIRLPQEIADLIRSETDIAVGIRLSLMEYDQDGYPPDYGLKVAESLKNIDYVHFSAGRNAPPGSSASFYSEHLHIYRKLPHKPKITTVIVGSITSREDAIEAMQKADFVSVGRGHLADPYFAKKILSGDLPLRPCIRCNQNCRDLNYGEVRCAVNPDLGYELREKRHYKLNGDVAIIGGGIKGSEAALYASANGLKVTLYEKRERIGGQLLDARDPFKKREFEALISFYETALKRAGVTVNTDISYKGTGIYCLPDITYPDVRLHDDFFIDTNVYRYHDEVLDFSLNGSVTMSNRSLAGMDRGRSEGFRTLALERGIKFTDLEGKRFDFSLVEKEQYDIRKATIAGRERMNEYIREFSNEYL